MLRMMHKVHCQISTLMGLLPDAARPEYRANSLAAYARDEYAIQSQTMGILVKGSGSSHLLANYFKNRIRTSFDDDSDGGVRNVYSSLLFHFHVKKSCESLHKKWCVYV